MRTVDILLIEDDPSDTFMVKEALRNCLVPVALTVAGDGEKALSLLTKNGVKPDLVILDLGIPRVSGISFLEKYQPRNRPPVIVFSSSWDQANIHRALTLGVCEVVHKPMSMDAFRDAVCGMVRKWGRAS